LKEEKEDEEKTGGGTVGGTGGRPRKIIKTIMGNWFWKTHTCMHVHIHT